jgi:hypothetical protein
MVRRLIYALLLIFFTLTACSSDAGPGPSPTPQGAYPPDPVFGDFYEKLGGKGKVGEIVSPIFPHGEESCQYTDAVLMCNNPQAKLEIDKYYLVPIGPLLVPPQVFPEPKIYEGFVDAYQQNMMGLRYVGKPISGVRVNDKKNRIEQYFEKMGLYQLLDDPRRVVHLMSFGSAVCSAHCAYKGLPDSAVIWDKGTEVPSLPSLLRIGGFDVVGKPISKPQKMANGDISQVFERVVVIIPADNPATIRFDNLPEQLKMTRNEPGPQEYGEKDGVSYYVVKDGLGFHVPLVFDAFITSHGGLELAGRPISDTFTVQMPDGAVIRQCFENYCLDFDTRQPEEKRIYLADLGSTFLKDKIEKQYRVFEFSPETTLLKVFEQKIQVSTQEEPVIEISVFQKDGLLPIPGIEAVLIVGMPDGSKKVYDVPATGLDGIGRVTLKAFSSASNGTVVPYVVCLNVPAKTQICQGESFLIWELR